MISTVSAEVEEGRGFAEVIKKAFPMGSMTGAPKIRAMQLIDGHEAGARGLFSGSVGYITPEGDFDFNVVIRSIFYNEGTKRLSYWAGSAITAKADAEQEYEECLLKLEAIRQVLG
jgi:para-aminobenzoate synthetase component 1